MRQQFWVRTLVLGLLVIGVCAARAQVTLVRLNEVLASNTSYTNSDGSTTDLLELYNTGLSPVDLGGCSLTDSNTFPRRFVFPTGTFVVGHGFHRIVFDSSQGSNGTHVPFGIKASGGYLWFYGPTTNLIDAVEYGLQASDFSFGRVTDGTGPWTLCNPTLGSANAAALQAGRGVLKVNEWLATQSSSGPKDYFEIYNPSNRPIDISRMYLSDNPSIPTKFQIPSNSFIGTGWISGYLKFTADSAVDKYPADHVNFGLATSESVILSEPEPLPTPVVVDRVDFTGMVNDVSEGRLPDGGTAIVRFGVNAITGYDEKSDGAPNFKFLSYTNIFVNELLSHTDPPLEDAVEIQNKSGTNINVSNWFISNSRSNLKRYKIPSATAIPHGGFRVIYEGASSSVGFNSSTAISPFTFNSAHGDTVIISEADATGKLTGYVIYEEFESAPNAVSYGHYNTSQTNIFDYKFVFMSARSFGVDDPNSVQEFRTGTGKTNPPPKVGPIVINEIMYQPSNTVYINTNGLSITNENPAEEYIELRNISADSVPFYDPSFPTNHWRLQKAIDFVFPITNLGPNEFCLIVGFDPATNTVALNNFRSRYNVSNNVPIYGPWIGRLKNSGDSIELYRPDTPQFPPHPDAGFVPYYRADKVNYDVGAPWPAGASGTGLSLQRKNSVKFGNDSINWQADAPTAGRSSSSAIMDTDGDGIPDSWENQYGLRANDPTDAGQDPDGDKISNLGEFLSGTNPTNSMSVLRVGQILSFEDTNKLIRFTAYSNATYTVQYRNSLSVSSEWQKLADIPAATTNRLQDVPDTNAWKKSDRYYRVVAPSTD
jgi:hypothetical protein